MGYRSIGPPAVSGEPGWPAISHPLQHVDCHRAGVAPGAPGADRVDPAQVHAVMIMNGRAPGAPKADTAPNAFTSPTKNRPPPRKTNRTTAVSTTNALFNVDQ
eukprot:gene8978-8118_t